MKLATGTVVVVTGAGSGIGRALALECARRGSTVALLDRDATRLTDLRNGIEATVPLSTHLVDVSDLGALRQVAAEVERVHGRVDVLINSAGVAVAAPFSQLAVDDFRWLIQTNFWGVVHACYAFLPALERGVGGCIANILSDFALLGFPTKSAYCASKFAVRGFAEALCTEVAGTGLSVTNVFPGPVDTNLIRDARVWDEAAHAREIAFVSKWGVPMQRVVHQTLRGIERRKRRVFIGGAARATDLAIRVAPVWVTSALGRWKHRVPFLSQAATEQGNRAVP